MFSKLKQLFQRKKNLPGVDVSLPKLLEWFDRHVQSAESEREFQRYVTQVGQLLQQLQEQATVLEQATIKEKDEGVDQKIKNVVLGHRNNYVREVRRFSELVELPQTLPLGEMLRFHELLQNYLTDLSQRTAKSYSATQHLFFEEVEPLAESLHQFSTLTGQFTIFLEQRGLLQVQEVRHHIATLLAIRKQQEKLRQDLELKKNRLQQAQHSKEQTSQRLTEIQEGEEYHRILALQDHKKALEEDLEQVGQDIFTVFSPLSRVFRKYEKISRNRLAGQYAVDPTTAFYQDDSLEIVPLLEGLRRALEEGSLELDENEEEKVLSVIDKLTVAFFHEVFGKYQQLQEQKEDALRQLAVSGVQNKLQEFSYKMDHFESLSQKLQQEIEEAQASLQSLPFDTQRQQVEQGLQKALQQQVNVLIE